VLADGTVAQACREPHCVCTEWQAVEMETLPAEDVRHYMTSGPVTVAPEATICEVAKAMLDAGVQRVIVLDPDRRPVGVVSTTDLIAALVAGDGDGGVE
jgi:CBS domain-containing protein